MANAKMNTTFRDGENPELMRLDMETVKCPFCHKTGGYPELIAHLQGHQRSALKYGGYNIYKCHLGCVASSHYHCSSCPRVIVKKDSFLNHFKTCCMATATRSVYLHPQPLGKTRPRKNTPTAKHGHCSYVTLQNTPKELTEKKIHEEEDEEGNDAKAKMNTTFRDGESPELMRLDMETVRCPFCHKTGGYPELIAHLQGHQRSVLKYGGYNIYKCHLGCVVSSHYHCSSCPRVIVKKDSFLNHFKTCCMTTATTTTPAMTTTAPATTATTTALATAATTRAPAPAATRTAPLATAATKAAPATTLTALAPAATRTAPPAPAATRTTTATGHVFTAPKMLLARRQTKTCCLCGTKLLKKNLKVHIQRHHTTKIAAITANCHLQSRCIDKKRGIFAVARSFKGPAHFIHVQKCTWGSDHRVSCQLDSCNRAYDSAERRGLLGFDCVHVRSLEFSPVTTASPIDLDKGVLTEMVESEWFCKRTERVCLRRKLTADTQGAPLTVEVNLGEEQGHIYFSVLEPRISSYSKLGRVMVHYDKTRDKWHCHCSKARKSCPHTSIAKWHLHQSRPDFFKTIEDCPDESFESFSTEETHVEDTAQADDGLLFPPEGKSLVEMMDYDVYGFQTVIDCNGFATKYSK
ncbi:uncharacterized protein LOC118292088 isoform X2 [Scophthalmus maximus]|uniref:uncharacterized protein LOC118292088 isoform X2 n=1 Tax=Scophthalmus maximus TaxID=52904 RepID=UPI001FA8828C|nr:uncharacterized protein LOC118292088 isoform X2 [Scophthalmus maximus]